MSSDPAMAGMLAYAKGSAELLTAQWRKWERQLAARVAAMQPGEACERERERLAAFRREIEFWETRR